MCTIMSTAQLRTLSAKLIKRNFAQDPVFRFSARNLSIAEHRYPEPILSAPETNVSKLSNGAKVATETRGGEIACLNVTVDVGSRFETATNSGATALIKELGFIGQEKEIAALGGMFSAESNREMVRFSATVDSKNAKKALEVLSKAATVSTCNPDTILPAKGRVLCDLEGARLRPEDYIMEHLHDAAFLDTTMGMPALGNADSISGMSDTDISEFTNRHFTGSRYIVAAVGNVDHESVCNAAESLLGSSAPSKSSEASMSPEECEFVGSDKRMRYDKMPYAHIALAFKGPPAGSEYSLPMQLITSILGQYDRRSGMDLNTSSRWQISLAEYSCAQAAGSFYIGYKDTGLLGFAGIAKDNALDDFMWFSLESLVRTCYKVTDEEVLRSKFALKTKLMRESVDTAGACEDISNQVRSIGRRLHPSELFARIDAISTDDVKATAYKFVHDQDHALAAVGPIFELPDYNWIRRRSYWLRY